jgi:hypothetical protein
VIDMANNAKFDIKTEAQKTLHAGVGAADRAIAAVREYVTEAQKRVEGYQKDAQQALTSAQRSARDFDVRTLPSQATTVVSTRVEELSKDAKARRIAIEKRVADLQAEAQKLVTETATDRYDGLVKRGETVVKNFRKKPATKQTVANAKTTTAKAKTTATQAKKSPAKKSAKATGTAAKKTVKSAAKTAS